MQSVAIFIQLGSVIEIDYTISDDGVVSSPSDPSRFKIWWESKESWDMGNTTLKKELGDLKSCSPFSKYLLSQCHTWDMMTKLLRKCHFYQKLWEIQLKLENCFCTGVHQRNKFPATSPMLMSVLMIGK